MAKYYVKRERTEKMNEPVFNDEGKIIAYAVSQSYSVRMHEMLYDQLTDEEKKEFVEEPSEN